ncbi:MAG: sigma-70 family RNA polymerase sigma factor [bacterium]
MRGESADSESRDPDITRLLSAARGGDPAAVGDVFDRVYAELRRIAHHEAARLAPSETMNTTAVVHEAYLKLVQASGIAWEDRAHFFRIAATAMRQILVDYARSRSTGKRGGGARVVSLDDSAAGNLIGVDPRSDEILALDSALSRLAALDERLARIVELRFFAGLSVEETAAAVGVADSTVKRDWRRARAYLLREIRESPPPPSGLA